MMIELEERGAEIWLNVDMDVWCSTEHCSKMNCIHWPTALRQLDFMKVFSSFYQTSSLKGDYRHLQGNAFLTQTTLLPRWMNSLFQMTIIVFTGYSFSKYNRFHDLKYTTMIYCVYLLNTVHSSTRHIYMHYCVYILLRIQVVNAENHQSEAFSLHYSRRRQ